MSNKKVKRIQKTIREMTLRLNELQDLRDELTDDRAKQAISHDICQTYVIIQSLMSL